MSLIVSLNALFGQRIKETKSSTKTGGRAHIVSGLYLYAIRELSGLFYTLDSVLFRET